jgi:hypothetical protein
VVDSTDGQSGGGKSEPRKANKTEDATHSIETSSAGFHFVFDKNRGSGSEVTRAFVESFESSSLTSVPMWKSASRSLASWIVIHVSCE